MSPKLLLFSLCFLLSAGYSFLRLRSWFGTARWRRAFLTLFALVVVAFPLVEWVEHNSLLALPRRLLLAGYLTMPYLLYLALTLALAEGADRAGRRLGIVPVRPRSGRLRTACRAALLLLPLAAVVAGHLHFRNLTVNRYRIAVPRRATVLDRLRIVVAADFHLGRLTEPGFMERFAARVTQLQPDLVLLPGDILEGHRNDGDNRRFVDAFRSLHPRFGVFAAPGNHEVQAAPGQLRFFGRAGIRLLRNRWIRIDRAFVLAGREAPHSRTRWNGTWLSDVPTDLPLILMNHYPRDFRAVSRLGVDLLLAGHSHGGQFFPFNLVTASQYDLNWGYRKIGSTHCFVTSGVQGSGPPVRTAGDAEIMLIDVEFTSSGR